MSGPLLLDTCAMIWAANGTDIPKLRAAMRAAWEQGDDLWISPISAWEVGNLAALGRLAITRDALSWFETSLTKAGAKLTELNARTLIASTDLPDLAHCDPADRIIIATAREFGLRIVTRDQKILDYAAKGHVLALAC